MATLTIDIPEELNEQIREICRRRGCSPEEAVQDLLRRSIVVEQFRKDAAQVRRSAQAAGFRSEEDIGRQP